MRGSHSGGGGSKTYTAYDRDGRIVTFNNYKDAAQFAQNEGTWVNATSTVNTNGNTKTVTKAGGYSKRPQKKTNVQWLKK